MVWVMTPLMTGCSINKLLQPNLNVGSDVPSPWTFEHVRGAVLGGRDPE